MHVVSNETEGSTPPSRRTAPLWHLFSETAVLELARARDVDAFEITEMLVGSVSLARKLLWLVIVMTTHHCKWVLETRERGGRDRANAWRACQPFPAE